MCVLSMIYLMVNYGMINIRNAVSFVPFKRSLRVTITGGKLTGYVVDMYSKNKVLFISSIIKNMSWEMWKCVQQKIWFVWEGFCYELLCQLYLDKNKADFWMKKAFQQFKDDKMFKEYLSKVYDVDGSGTAKDVFGWIWEKNGRALEYERIPGRLYKGGYKSLLFHYNFPIFVVRNALDYSPCTLFSNI